MNFQKFLSRSVFGLLLIFSLAQDLSAQIPSFCLESPASRWQEYFTHLGNNQSLGLHINKYQVSQMTLNLKTLASSMSKMTGFGAITYSSGEREGNSCLKTKNISIKNPQSGVAATVPIRGAFGAGQLGTNPGSISLNNVNYSRTASSGDVHLFKKDGGGAVEFLVVFFDKI